MSRSFSKVSVKYFRHTFHKMAVWMDSSVTQPHGNEYGSDDEFIFQKVESIKGKRWLLAFFAFLATFSEAIFFSCILDLSKSNTLGRVIQCGKRKF